jgi:hypothetical protein
MTPYQRQRIALAPELAVIHVLRAAAEATCAALAAAYPMARLGGQSPEQELAERLFGLLDRLDRAAATYCDYLDDLPQMSFVLPDDSF